MISRDKTIRFIQKLIDLTEKKKTVWTTLPYYFDSNDNEPLRKYVITNNAYAYSPRSNVPVINEYGSFCADINGGVVVVISESYDGSITQSLLLQTSPMNPVISLYNDVTVRGELRELVTAISSQQDDVDAFISEILES